MQNEQFLTNSLVDLSRTIETSFNDEELRSLCFDLGVNYDNLPGDTLSSHIRELVDHLNRRYRMGALISALENERPHINWATIIPAFDDKDAAPPFKGLENFTENDNHLFFGRDVWITSIVNRLSATKFLAVVGASGSGKSSLVQAGVVPVLKGNRRRPPNCQAPSGSRDWLHCLIRPDVHPIKELAIALTQDKEPVTATTTLMDDLMRDNRSLDLYVSRLLKEKGKEQLFLVIDQFEELFTLCHDEDERVAFVDNLIVATAPETAGRIRLILTLRADFYHYCANYPLLRDAVAENQIYIGGMELPDLRAAIEGPAECEGYEFEPGLVDLILRDVGDELGGLPLLSHALRETWERRRGRVMTLQGYNDAGGVGGAIEHTAENTYASLTPDQQKLTRNIFLRLTELGEGSEDTRRRVELNELVPADQEADAVRQIIKLLADKRLITTARKNDETEGKEATDAGATVEVAHEALIREWQMLRTWLNENREGLRRQQQLTHIAAEWEAAGREESYLFRGVRLGAIEEWLAADSPILNAQEQAFVEASVQLRDKEIAEVEARRLRELELERQRTKAERERAEEQTRTSQRLRIRAAMLFVAFVVAVIASLFALDARNDAESSELLARARLYIAQGQAAFADNPLLGLRLVLEGLTLVESEDEAVQESVLSDSREKIMQWGRVLKLGHDVERIWVAQGNSFFVIERQTTASEVRLVADGSRLATLEDDDIRQVTFSPDGSLFVVDYLNQPTEIRKAVDGSLMLNLQDNSIRFVTFSPDGSLFVVDYWNKPDEVRLVADGSRLVTLKDNIIRFVTFSPDGSLFAVHYRNATAEVWLIADGSLLATLRNDDIRQVFFSPDGSLFVVDYGSLSNEVRLVADGSLLTTIKNDNIRWVTFSPDGSLFVVDYWNKTDEVRLAADGSLLAFLSKDVIILNVTFSPDGSLFVVDYWNKPDEVRLVADGSRLATLKDDDIRQVTFSPDGSLFVVDYLRISDEVWLVKESSPIYVLKDDNISQVFFSPNSSIFVVDYLNLMVPEVRLVTDGSLLAFLSNGGNIFDVTFSPDGSLFLVVYGNKPPEVRLVADGSPFPALQINDINRVFFSPDGSLFVVDYGNKPDEVRLVADGSLLTALEDDFIRNVTFSPYDNLFVVDYDNLGDQLWLGNGLTYLGVGTANYLFLPNNEFLILRFNDGASYLLDITWLQAMGSDLDRLPISELIEIACDGPLARGIFSEDDEAALKEYLGGQEPQACQ